jgi:MoaA/NifB/PqqE/SkfB family radical SAM enzyme
MDSMLLEKIHVYQKQNWYKNKLLGVIPETYSNPTGVQLEITYKCILKCKHCYNESGWRSQEKFPEELSPNQWLDIAHELVDSHIFAVIISGGEPFLNIPLVMKMVEIFDRADIRMGIISNGWFLEESVVKSLAQFQKSINWVQISLDGANSQVHDCIRGVKGSFDRAVRAITNLRKYGFHVKIASAIMPQNMHQLEDFFELALFLGANTLHIGHMFNIGAARDIEVDKKLKDSCINKLVEYKELYSDCMEVMISMDPCESVQVCSRYRLNNAYIIRPNGELKLDCAVPVIFGRYKKPGDLIRLWKESGLDKAYENETVQSVIADIVREQSFANIYDTKVDFTEK